MHVFVSFKVWVVLFLDVQKGRLCCPKSPRQRGSASDWESAEGRCYRPQPGVLEGWVGDEVEPWRAGGQIWKDKLPKACVLLSLQLDKNNMLPSSVVEELKELYGGI